MAGRKTVETFGGGRTFVRRSDPPNTGLKAQLRGEAHVPASRRLALLVILVPAFAWSASCPDQTAECVPDDARKTPGGHTFTGEHLEVGERDPVHSVLNPLGNHGGDLSQLRTQQLRDLNAFLRSL